MIRSKMVDRILALKLKEPVKIYYLDDVGFITFRELV